MYSTRHIIIHNCSIKDKDYLAQTGEPESEFEKKVELSLKEIRRLISVTRKVSKLLNNELKEELLKHNKSLLNFANLASNENFVLGYKFYAGPKK